MTNKKNNKGSLEVICGSMFSGKTEELIRRLKRATIAKRKFQTFKHSLDTRRSSRYVLISHNGTQIKAIPTNDPTDILSQLKIESDIIAIDEVQFFASEILNVVNKLIQKQKRVIVAGLDLDFRGAPFGCMSKLLAMADKITKLKAICIVCGREAFLSQRLVDGKPAKYSDPLIIIGAEEKYQARCRNCFEIDSLPDLTHEK